MRWIHTLFMLLTIWTVGCLTAAADNAEAGDWRRAKYMASLKNNRLSARFQAGRLVELKELPSGKTLLSIDPVSLSPNIPLFGSSGVNLDEGEISQELKNESATIIFNGSDGTEWTIRWTLEPGDGDLILNTSAKTPQPVDRFSMLFPGCDIVEHSVVWVSVYGAGHVLSAPWTGSQGDVHNGISRSYIQPNVALFEGNQGGWFLEGRAENIGPANILLMGRGQTVDATLVRGFPVKTNEPGMFEIRIRTYQDNWADAVDPFVEWMEKGAGFVPIEKQSPSWIKDIEAQAYVRLGNFDGLDKLAREVIPSRTMIGRMVGWRELPMDYGYPDYRVNETAQRWFKHARDLGFHVGAHFNTSGVGKNNKELLKRFERGFAVTGIDEKGNKTYQEVPGAGRHRYCSTALKDWREYLIKQMRHAVEVGVDLIYIDESMAPTGAFMVDGMTAIEGVMTLAREIKEAYPHVAVETEQFNPMTVRHASFALNQMPLGHPLSGYIFRRYLKILPAGITSMPTDVDMLDAVQSYGFMIPGGGLNDSWMAISRAFQDYGLVPDPRLPRTPFTKFAFHPSHGVAPVATGKVPPEGIRLFGYQGRNGVTAYYEKHPARRGLVVYEPRQEPKWIGTRISGISSWPRQGGVITEVSPGIEDHVADWMTYNDETILGLIPEKTYSLDESKTLTTDRFHLTSIPEDFCFHYSNPLRILPVHHSDDRSFYRLTFTGHGSIGMVVPENMLVFLNGEEVTVDPKTRTATATIDATAEQPGSLIAFQKRKNELSGPWSELPWQVSMLQRPFYLGQHQVLDYSTEGPVRKMRYINGFYTHVTGTGVIIGKMPESGVILIQGGYGMREESLITAGDAVIRINGKEIMRVPAGKRPFKVHSFTINVSSYAGKYVMLEFLSDGRVHGPTAADWHNPRIAVNPEHEIVPTDQLKILEDRGK